MSAAATETQHTVKVIFETLAHYMTPARAAVWLDGARLGLIDGVLVIQVVYEIIRKTLERNCSAEIAAAAEHLLGKGKKSRWRIDVYQPEEKPVNVETRSKELF